MSVYEAACASRLSVQMRGGGMSVYEAEARQLIADRPGFAREVARLVNSDRVQKLSSNATGGLTARQRDLLLYIRKYIGEHGIAPSFDEMKAAQGLASKSGIHRMISGLEERGFITRMPGRARALRLAVPA